MKQEGQLGALRTQLAGLPAEKRASVQREFDELEKEHRRGLLELGAAGRLALTGEVEVLPLDDEETPDRARPMTRDGRIQFDPASVEARHDAQLRAAMASGPCSLLILGGSHNLSPAVRRFGQGDVEYLRVTTWWYRIMGMDRP
jgi:hypothetical protein